MLLGFTSSTELVSESGVTSMDWTVVGVISAAVAGVGGLAWKIWSDQRARRQDVEVRIESINWGSDRSVAIRVINTGDTVVRVVLVGCQVASPSSSRTSLPRSDRTWSMGEQSRQQGELPKEIAPRDGHLFTLLIPVAPDLPDLGGGRGGPPRQPRQSQRRTRVGPRPGAQKRWENVSVQAWAKMSTGKTIYSPVFPSRRYVSVPRRLSGTPKPFLEGIPFG
jgi:hypothetical protein